MIAEKIIDTLYGPLASRFSRKLCFAESPHAIPGSSPGRRAAVRICPSFSSIRRIERQLLRDFRLPAVAVREELFLVVEKLFASLGGELQIRSLDDRIDRTGFLAVAAVNAFRHINIIARRAAAAVLAWLGLDRNAQRRADRLAQFAGNAALLAIGVAAQHVLAAKSRADRVLLVW